MDKGIDEGFQGMDEGVKGMDEDNGTQNGVYNSACAYTGHEGRGVIAVGEEDLCERQTPCSQVQWASTDASSLVLSATIVRLLGNLMSNILMR